MTERPDPETAPVPGPGDADPDRAGTPGAEPVPAPFSDPDVAQPPVEEPATVEAPGVGAAATAGVGGSTFATPAPEPEGDDATVAQAAAGSERPELLVAGAFAGGLAVAMILRRLGR